MVELKAVVPGTEKDYKIIKIDKNSKLEWMKDDEVYYVSEHRGSFNNEKEFKISFFLK